MDGGHQHSHRRHSQELNLNGGAATNAPGQVRASTRHGVRHLADFGSAEMRPVRAAEYASSISFASPASPARPPSHILHAHPPPGYVMSTEPAVLLLTADNYGTPSARSPRTARRAAQAAAAIGGQQTTAR